MNLATVPADVSKIALPVSIHEAEARGHSFGQLRNAFIRVVNQAGGAEFARYGLSEDAATETASSPSWPATPAKRHASSRARTRP